METASQRESLDGQSEKGRMKMGRDFIGGDERQYSECLRSSYVVVKGIRKEYRKFRRWKCRKYLIK